MQGCGQQTCGKIFIDDGFDADQVAIVSSHDGNATSACTDDNKTSTYHTLDGRALDNTTWGWGWHHPAPATACILHHRPAILLLHLSGMLFIIENANRFARLLERGISRINQHLGHQRHSLFCQAPAT